MSERVTSREITRLVVDLKKGDITFFSHQEAVGRLPVDSRILKTIAQGFLGALRMRPPPPIDKTLPEGKKPAIRDIARLAGVSVATVSSVINQARYVSPELADRVQSVITEVGYKPNPHAQLLKRRRTPTRK